MVRLLPVFLILLLSNFASGQISKLVAGIDGLTCSMCSNSVEKKLEELSFIDHLKMDLNEAEVEIFLKDSGKPDLHLIPRKIKDAGFSIRSLSMCLESKNDLNVNENDTVDVNGIKLVFLKISSTNIKSGTEIIFVDKPFLTKSEFEIWKRRIGQPSDPEQNIYHVTLR